MDLIVVNDSGTEVGYAKNFSIDVDVGVDDDFELEVNKADDFKEGYFVAEEGTEYGGVLSKIVTNTGSKRITYGGHTFRGILDKRVIRPLNEGTDDYRTVSGNIGTIISTFLTEFDLTDLFVAEETTATISTWQFERYCTFLDGMTKLLKSIEKKLVLKYDSQTMKIHVSVDDINDFADEIEMSDDCKIKIKFSLDSGMVNHLICLGSGDLHERLVADLYVAADGTISETQTLTGLDEIVETYESTSDADLTTLKANGTKHLQEIIRQTVEFSVDEMDVDLYDIVGAREYSTGKYFSAEVTQKIIRGTETTKSIEYKVGD